MLNIAPDRYCPKGKAFAMRGVKLASVDDVVNFDVGQSLSFDRLGSSDLETRIKSLVTRMARSGGPTPDTVIMNPDQYAQLQEYLGTVTHVDREAGTFTISTATRPRPAVGALSHSTTAIAATCAIAGLGLLIARRNAVMAEEGPDESWLKAFIAWACEYVRALFAPQPLALPAHEESDAA